MPRGPTSTQDPPVLIESQAQIDEWCAQIRNDGRFGFDTEFVMEDRYQSEVCLIQLAAARGVALVDPFLKLDIQPVWALICDPDIETVVHAGMEDINLCLQHTGKPARRVFDLQIAAGLIGGDYPVSLQKLVKAKLGIVLHKSKTLTDWRRRPLTDAQIHYASEDVAHLLPIHRKIRNDLRRRKRTSWAREEFARLEATSLSRGEEGEVLLKLKGAGRLDGRALAIVREVLCWRDEIAQRRNRPARTVVKDHLLVEIARHSMSTVEEIRDLRGINLSTRDVRALAVVVTKARAIPHEEWPATQPTWAAETPDEAILIALTSAAIRSYCKEQAIAYSLAATKKSIQALVRAVTRDEPGEDEPPNLTSGWRADTVGALARDILTGRRSLRVARENGRHRVHISDVDS